MSQSPDPKLLGEIEHYLSLLIASYHIDDEEIETDILKSGLIAMAIEHRAYDRQLQAPWWLTFWRGRWEYAVANKDLLSSFTKLTQEFMLRAADEYQAALDQARVGNLEPAGEALTFMVDSIEKDKRIVKLLLSKDLERLNRILGEINQLTPSTA